jgi:hypothetical protein
MAAPVVIGSVSGISYAGGGITGVNYIGVPTNISGDLLLLVTNGVGVPEYSTIAPSGWTECLSGYYAFSGDSTYFSRGYWKISNGSEPTGYGITSNSYATYKAQMLAIRGAANPATRPIVTGFGIDEIPNTDVISPSITVNYNESLIVRVVNERQSACTFTPPSGYNEIYDNNSTWGSATIAVSTGNTGVNGPVTFISSVGWPASYVLPVFALAPAAEAGGGGSPSGSQALGSLIHIMFPGRQWLVEPGTTGTDSRYSLVGLYSQGNSSGSSGGGSAVSMDSSINSYTAARGGMRLNLGLLGSDNSVTYGQGQMRSSLRFSGLSSSIVNLYGNLGVLGAGGLLGTLFSTQSIQYNYSPFLYSRTGAGGSGQLGNISVHGGLRVPYTRDVNKSASVFSRMQSRLRNDETLTISGIVSITGNYRFVINARNENNQAINLTTVSGTTVIFTSPSSEVIRRGASYVTDGTDGSVYTITSGSQFSMNGTWCLQLQTTGMGSIYTSKKYRFKVG